MAELALTKVGETEDTITLGWDPVASADAGYRFTSSEFPDKHPHTWDPARSTVKFHKGPDGTVYTVEALDVIAVGSYPAAEPPPPPPPPPGLETISVSEFNRRATAGAVVANVHVTGSVRLSAENVTVQGSVIDGDVDIDPDAPGAKLLSCTLRRFNIWGADDVTVDGCTIDGQGQVANNQMWDAPAGNVPQRIRITNNTIKNFYVASDPGTHCEGLYIGYSSDVLIENNDFVNNGNTGHIFFTWWGSTANPATSYPRNVCVRGNRFYETHGAYVDVNFRSEIPTSSGIRIQSNASTTSPQFYGDC